MTRRVLHVIPFLWSGAGRVVTHLSEAQARAHEVHVATSGRSSGERDWPAYRARLRSAGVEWHRVDTFARAPDSFWPELARLEALVREVRPHVIHAHAGVPTLMATIVAGAPGGAVPVIGQMYSWGIGRPSWMDTMDLAGFARADTVVVSARRYEQVLLDGGVARRRLRYVPWGIDLPPAGFTRRPGRGVRLGFVGRIEPRKDQHTLVDVVAGMRRRGVDATLVLVGPDGDPAYADEVRRRVGALGLVDHVRLTGSVRSIWPWLARMDAFVSLSQDEGQGVAVLEAMAAGVPVFARPAAGLEDFIRDGVNALWLPRSGAERVAGALALAVDDRAGMARRASRARREVERRFTWASTLAALETAYGW